MIIFETLFIILLGCLLHFVYEWSHENKIVGWFAAVNESTWEHIKLALVPSFLFIMVDFGTFGDNANYWFGKFIMFIMIIILVPVLFYTEKAIVKRTILWLDVMIFMVSIIYAVLIFDAILGMTSLGLEVLGVIGTIIVFILMALFTFYPPKCFLFMDPRNNKYGFEGHTKGRTRKK